MSLANGLQGMYDPQIRRGPRGWGDVGVYMPFPILVSTNASCNKMKGKFERTFKDTRLQAF
jgi:hypothetical protein